MLVGEKLTNIIPPVLGSNSDLWKADFQSCLKLARMARRQYCSGAAVRFPGGHGRFGLIAIALDGAAR